MRVDPRLLDGHQPEPPDHRAAVAPRRHSILHDEALQALRANPDAEAFQLAIPDEEIGTQDSNLRGFQPFHHAFCEFFHACQALAPKLLPRRVFSTLGSRMEDFGGKWRVYRGVLSAVQCLYFSNVFSRLA